MKKSLFAVQSVVLALLVIGIMPLSPGNVFAQDTLVKKPQKVMKIKIDMDEDGKSVTIDTTFVVDGNFDMEQFQEAMKEYEIQMKDMEKYVQEMEIELNGEEMQKAMHKAHVVMKDVSCDMPRRKNFHGTQCHPRFQHSCGPETMHFFGRPEECREMVRIVPPNRGESLSDVLGDIPMSAVKSYKIKETKTGKRITIEVSDDALFDLDEDVIIWHDDVAPPPPPPPPKIRKEVIIEKNADTERDSE